MACQAEATGGCTCGFHIALNEFKRSLKDEDLVRSFQGTKLQHLTAEIAKIQQEQVSKRRLRYMKRIEPFLNTMQHYGKVVEVFVNAEEIVAFIWGPIKFLLVTASSFSEAFDSLLDAYQSIWEQLPLFEAYSPTLGSRPYLRTVLVWIYNDILEFHQEAIGFFKNRVWRQLFKAVWRGFIPKIEFMKDKMARHARLLEQGAAFVHLEEIDNLRREARERFETQREDQLNRKRSDIISWLNPYPSQLSKYREARICRDSGSWLLRNSQFRGWFDPTFCTDPLLWITGIPGAGKSVLASVIIDAAQNLDVPDTDISVAFFFCQPGDDNANTFVAVVRSILAQLICIPHNASLVPHVYEQTSLSGEVTLCTNDLAKTLLANVLGCCKNTYIIIDGLDACNKKERKEIVSSFRTVVESLPTNRMHDIRCVFLCQDDGVARRDLANLPKVRIDSADNKSDIEQYWKRCKKHLEDVFGPLGFDIVKIVTAQAQGMFLYATLVFLHLKTLSTPDQLRNHMHHIPKELDELYERIVERLCSTDEYQAKDCMSLLGQLAGARRPLKWYEVQGVGAIDLQSEKPTVNFQKLSRGLKHTQRELCGPLVDMRPDQTLEFIHPTARDYLLKHHFKDQPIHFELCTLSIAYLNFEEITKEVSASRIPLLLEDGCYVFLEYAVTCWSLHLHDALQEETVGKESRLEELQETLESFLDVHWVGGSTTQNVPKSVIMPLSRLETSESYDRLCQSVAAVKRQLSQHHPAGLEEGPLDLGRILRRVRDTLAMWSESGNMTNAQKDALYKCYGRNWFKCSMMSCQFFHQGFPTRSQLDAHMARHDRPFLCIDTSCNAHIFGFPTKEMLHQHLIVEHAIDMSDATEDLEFSLPTSVKSSRNGDGGPSKFACPTCHKTFTRNHNLQTHLRVHRNERPYPCDQCNQSFTRSYDRDRHQALHTGQKQFLCRGELASGGTWGCGREFARQDKLVGHFKSKAGRKCIQPLFQEEAVGSSGGDWNARIAEILSSRFILDSEQLKPLITTLSQFPESWARVEGRGDDGEESSEQDSGHGKSPESELGTEEPDDGSNAND